MGDFVSPKRAVVDRLRRRIETYKRGHKNALNRGHYSFPQYFENQRQDTVLLHQKWIEGKAKKTAKNTRINKETPTTSGNTHTQARPKKFKTDSSSEIKSSCEAIEEHISPTLNQQNNTKGTSKHSVSVNIEQIIKTPQSSGSHIEIKLKSTVHTSQVDSATTQISTSTNICKEEPQDTGNSNPSSNGSLSIGIDDVDELQEILDALEQGSGLILKDFEVDNSFPDSENLKKENNCEPALIQNQGSTSKSLSNSDFPTKSNSTVAGSNTFFDSSTKDYSQQTRDMYAGDANQQYSSMATQGPVSSIGVYNRPAVPIGQNPSGQAIAPSIPSFADTGPAAKTLQQMAAQHQSHSNVPTHYGSPGYMPDGRNNISNFARTGYEAQSSANETYQYNHNVSNLPMYMKGHDQEMKPEPSSQMPYTNPTKTLTHYNMSAHQNTGNSIQSQQIHNQNAKSQQINNQNVKGQYSQASNQSCIQITQSQQVSVNPAQSRMNFSQAQQMQVHSNNAHPLTLSQQQSFHLGSNEQPQSIPPQHMAQQQQHIASVSTQQNMSSAAQGMGQSSYLTEQMKLQMYQEKMMQQQQMRNRMQQHQMQQQQQGRFSERPPPSYSNSTVPHGGMNSNPLQTMQIMVEQTNHSSTESSCQGPMKQNNIPGHTLPQTSQANTSVQPSQNYPSVQTNQNNGSTGNNSKTESSNYTSTIMRGQRPPNVNIGPEGLNISQPRMNQWRQMTPSQSHGIIHRPPSDHNHQMPPYQNYGGHMPSNMYPYRMQMAQQQSIHMAQQHQQRMPMPGGISNTMTHNIAMQQQMRGSAPMPQASVAMMMGQQQHMHHMNSNQMVGSSMPHSHQSNTVIPNVTSQNPNFPLDFLDQHHHPQSGPPDLFDPVQNGNPTDFTFEDILGGK